MGWLSLRGLNTRPWAGIDVRGKYMHMRFRLCKQLDLMVLNISAESNTSLPTTSLLHCIPTTLYPCLQDYLVHDFSLAARNLSSSFGLNAIVDWSSSLRVHRDLLCHGIKAVSLGSTVGGGECLGVRSTSHGVRRCALHHDRRLRGMCVSAGFGRRMEASARPNSQCLLPARLSNPTLRGLHGRVPLHVQVHAIDIHRQLTLERDGTNSCR